LTLPPNGYATPGEDGEWRTTGPALTCGS